MLFVNILFSGLGKSTLINSLFLTNLYEDREVPEAAVKAGQTVSIEASTVEIEERGVKELIQILGLVLRVWVGGVWVPTAGFWNGMVWAGLKIESV